MQLEAELSIPEAERFYCPRPDCSALLLLPLGGASSSSRISVPAICPECHALVCVACKVAWHTGMTCREFQARPLLNPPPDKPNNCTPSLLYPHLLLAP